jgi:hypothetical protein
MKKRTAKGAKSPQKNITEKMRETDKKYQLSYNDVRRERYQNDPAYREKAKERERQRYQRVAPSFVAHDFGSNAGKARKFAIPRKMYSEDDTLLTVAVLAVNDMALFLNVASKVFRKWVWDGKFPDSNKRSKCGRTVYTINEANALAAVMRKHFKGRAAFRPTDTEAIEELREAYDALQE